MHFFSCVVFVVVVGLLRWVLGEINICNLKMFETKNTKNRRQSAEIENKRKTKQESNTTNIDLRVDFFFLLIHL